MLTSKKALEIELEKTKELVKPRKELEQYTTPASIAADMIWEEAARGSGARLVVDLGAGTGRLCLGAAKFLSRECVAVEIDDEQLKVFLENAELLGVTSSSNAIRGDVTALPLRRGLSATVMMNPPFGTVKRGLDRKFLEAATEVAERIYSLHYYNEKLVSLLAKVAEERGYKLVKVKKYSMQLKQTMEHHVSRRKRIPAALLVLERG